MLSFRCLEENQWILLNAVDFDGNSCLLQAAVSQEENSRALHYFLGRYSSQWCEHRFNLLGNPL